MKLKFYPMIATALVLSIMPCSRADKHIQIEMSDAEATPVEVDVARISRIKFDVSSFNLEFNDETATDVFNYTQVKRIVIKDGQAAIGGVDVVQPMVVMPNPVRDHLYLQGGSDLYGADVDIYSVTGMRVMSQPNWSGDVINVSHLSPGVYVINIQSVTLKFVKL